MSPIARPAAQENGNKEDVHWPILDSTNAPGCGLRVESVWQSLLILGPALHRRRSGAARHNHDLHPRPRSSSRWMPNKAALGNSSCGPGVLEKILRAAEGISPAPEIFSPVKLTNRGH